jgi:hypothetical protein
MAGYGERYLNGQAFLARHIALFRLSVRGDAHDAGAIVRQTAAAP